MGIAADSVVVRIVVGVGFSVEVLVVGNVVLDVDKVVLTGVSVVVGLSSRPPTRISFSTAEGVGGGGGVGLFLCLRGGLFCPSAGLP